MGALVQLDKQAGVMVVKLMEFGHAVKSEDVGDAGKIPVPSHAAPEVFAKVLHCTWYT